MPIPAGTCRYFHQPAAPCIESHGDEALFYKKLDDMLELVAQQLLDRLKFRRPNACTITRS